MASLSSTGSVSSSSSLGNTSLRGFGGMMSGIDRDSIIEQMTMGTTTKISNVKKEMTSLSWKQEAYQSISDKIINLSDKYSNYSSSSSLVDSNTFARSIITAIGNDTSSKYVKASGTSAMVDTMAISAVRQLATSTVRQSREYTGTLKTELSDLSESRFVSNLQGRRLSLGTYNEEKGWGNVVTFEFPTQCQALDEQGNLKYDKDGKEVMEDINYETDDYGALAAQLNRALAGKTITVNGESVKLNEAMKFVYDDASGVMKIEEVSPGSLSGYSIRSSSSALSALGYSYTVSEDDEEDKAPVAISLDVYNAHLSKFDETSYSTPTALSLLSGAKAAFNYNGSQKEIELLTDEDLEKMEGKTEAEKLEIMRESLQKRLDRAFGSNNVTVTNGTGGLEFSTNDARSSISITASDSSVLTGLGITSGASSKVNMSDKLGQAAFGINLDEEKYADGLKINGVEIKGITRDSTITDILSKINESDAGVKATYVNATGQFMLVTDETGAGREITLDSQLAKDIFGNFDDEGEDVGVTYGQNAVIDISYGNGVNVTLSRASNTFELEGLSVTVSGVFGGEYTDEVDENGEKVWKFDTADRVTFSAKADVDAVTEKVKSFFEDYNELVTEVYNQLTTRSDSSYGPLTEEQKAEMNETSITNWENKAKEGILYNDNIIRDLNSELEGMFVQMMGNGMDYQTLESIGISYDESWAGGATTIVFNESKFRAAMEKDPDLVSDIFTGGTNVNKGLVKTVDNTLTAYATRYASRNGGNSYGRLIDEAGSQKVPTSVSNNFIYQQLKEMEERIATLQDQLKVQQDRYISQFTTMETLINQYNTQASYLSNISG